MMPDSLLQSDREMHVYNDSVERYAMLAARIASLVQAAVVQLWARGTVPTAERVADLGPEPVATVRAASKAMPSATAGSARSFRHSRTEGRSPCAQS